MGTTILESNGTWMEGMDRQTYWILPLHVLAQAACYKIFGFSLLTMRGLSIFSGAVILWAWYSLIFRFSQSPKIALLTVTLLIVDSHFAFVTSLGRMDAMCSALGWAGTAAFVCLRERSLPAALFCGNALVAASCLTHPCGFLHFLVLSFLTLYFDRERITLQGVSIAALPYLVALGAWSFYILKNPTQFWSQLTGNISGIASEFVETSRWSGLKSPLLGFRREIARYFAAYGWYSAPNIWERSKVALVAFYSLGILGSLATKVIRRKREDKALLITGSLLFVIMALFEGLKAPVYAVHTLPIAAALVAICVAHYSEVRGTRGLAVALVSVFLCLQLAYAFTGYLNPRGRWDYEAMLKVVRNNTTPSSLIIGTGELAFDLGFDANLIDDPRLGYYSGKQADLIVAGEVYSGWFQHSRTRYPQIHEHIQRLLKTSYREVFRNSSYIVYERTAAH
jgi:hypothetical protein